MSTNFFPTRGCLYAIPSQGGSPSKGIYGLPSEGIYRLKGVTDQKGKASAILMTGLDMLDSDVVAPVITTEDLKVLYVFGKAFGRVSIQGQILLGAAGSSNDKLLQLQDWFESRRVAVSKKPVTLSVANKAYTVYITGLAIGAVDVEYNIQLFGLEGLIAS